MIATQQRMDIITNNLANASTNGFKKDGIAFTDLMVRQLQSGGQSIGSMGSGSSAASKFTSFERGPITTTHNPLDVAITSEQGLFAVEHPEGNTMATRYTRDGSFSFNTNRELVTKQGFRVLDDRGQPITIPTGSLDIGQDGSIQVDGKTIAKIGLYQGSFSKMGQNLYSSSNSQAIADPQMQSGAIEGSNVNPIEEMVSMITLSRSFEMAQKSITQQDDLTGKLIQSIQQ